MKCKKCKKEIPTESVFCMFCGSAQTQKKKKTYQRPDGLFEKSVTINGKRVVFRGKTEKEITQKIANYEEKKAKGRLFNEVAEEWKEEHYPSLSPTTQRGYNPHFNRAIEFFNNIYIKEIEPKHVQALINDMASKNYSHKSVSNQMIILSSVFDFAGVKGELESNPSQFTKIPRGLSRKKRDVPTSDELNKVKANINVNFGLFAYLLLYTGLRKGEALALQFKDIDENFINVNKSIYYVDETPRIKEPKTEAGKRRVPLLSVLKGVLPNGKANEYVFGGKEPLKKGTFESYYLRYQKQTGITATAHQFRHAFATMLHEANVSEKDAQEILGHANIATTKDIYTHITERRLKDTTKILDTYTKNTQ